MENFGRSYKNSIFTFTLVSSTSRSLRVNPGRSPSEFSLGGRRIWRLGEEGGDPTVTESPPKTTGRRSPVEEEGEGRVPPCGVLSWGNTVTLGA